MSSHPLFFALAAGIVLMSACQNNYQYTPDKLDRGNTEQTVDGEFPIVAWTGLDKPSDSDNGFIAMKECGINTYLWWYDSLDDVMYVLDNAERDGMKVILRSPELLSDTEKAVARMKNHPALMGYFIEDEPERSDIPWLSEIVTKLQKLDPGHFNYINIYPNWCWGGVNGYDAIVSEYLNKVPVSFLSFDFYPIWERSGIHEYRPGWFANLESARRLSRRFDIPFWAFALSSPGEDPDNDVVWPVATLAHLRVQMFCNLVYGAQAFQYFTYHGICKGGAKTTVYERVKKVNAELQGMAPVFLGADIKNVWHTGTEIPEGTRALDTMPYGVASLKTGDRGAVVSQVEKDGCTYIAIVNKDYENDMQLEISFDRKVKRLDKFGYILAESTYSGPFAVAPGDIVLFQIL